MLKKLFIGLESPVPPSTLPAATSSAKPASAGLGELNAYQASVFWHQAMKAVAPQTSPITAIEAMAPPRSAAPSAGRWLPQAPASPKRRSNSAG